VRKNPEALTIKQPILNRKDANRAKRKYMSTNNPLIPQGSLEEQKPRNKSNVYIAVFAILAFHVVLLGALLLQGCKDRQTNLASTDNQNTTVTGVSNPVTPTDIGMQNPFATPTNPVVIPTPGPTIGIVSPTPSNVVETATTTTAGVREHAVAKGESFYTIGKKYGVSSTDIAKANPGVDSRKLQLGQKIKIPERTVSATTPTATATSATGTATTASSDSYKVKKGDTLIRIAKAQGTTVEKIKAANNLKTSSIRAGQQLKLPAKAEAPAATTPASTGYVTPLPGRTTASL
jgi:LysM repeat protein